MDLFEAINQRHSYRGPFRHVAIPRRDLDRILQAGLEAPSGRNHQTTTFLIIDDREILQHIGALPDAPRCVQDARAMILAIIDSQPQRIGLGETFEIEDCAAAVENMLLSITALGYASCWMDGWLRRNAAAEQIGAMVGLPDYKVVRVLLPIGVPAEPVTGPVKKTFDQRAWYNRYPQ